MSTKYRCLSDIEFLRIVEERLGRSAIIDELYERFSPNKDIDTDEDLENISIINCPVCECKFKLESE